jgi:hypothetical protein
VWPFHQEVSSHSKNGAANFFGLFVDALNHFVQVLDWCVIACFQIRS